MKKKYHLNPKTGRPNVCRASKKPCPISDTHFDNEDDARAHFEALQKASLPAPHRATHIDSRLQEYPYLWSADLHHIDQWADNLNIDETERENYRLSQTHAVNALRAIAEERGGSMLSLNSGAHHRLVLKGKAVQVEAQGGPSTIHVRVFCPRAPTLGLEDSQWKFVTPPNPETTLSTIEKILDDFLERHEEDLPR